MNKIRVVRLVLCKFQLKFYCADVDNNYVDDKIKMSSLLIFKPFCLIIRIC